MAVLLQLFSTLVGVIVGGLATFLLTTASEKARWRRDQKARWDVTRMQVYVEYSNAVKRVAYLTTGMAAARGFKHPTPPLTPDDVLPELNAAIAERTARWESVLLLGDPATIMAARNWHQCLWELEHFARGELDDHDEWRLAWSEFEQMRHKFYQSARAGLGVAGELPDVTWTPPWRVRVGLGHPVTGDGQYTDVA